MTLEEELQELVERMLDDSDFAADTDIVSRAIKRLKEKSMDDQSATSETWAFNIARAIVEPNIDHDRAGEKFVVIGASLLVPVIARALISAARRGPHGEK